MTFDELHILVTRTYTDALAEGKKRKEIEEIMDDCFFEFLVDAYIAGLYEQDLENPPQYDPDRAIEVVELRYGTDEKNVEERIREHVVEGDLPRLITLADTEYHRVYETGAFDNATQAQEAFNREFERSAPGKTPGKPVIRQIGPKHVMKTWLTMMDDRVRDTHAYIEAVTIPYDERFYTYDGDSARFPGDFYNVENNANCRCSLKYSIAR